jgi:Ca2+-binding EF-hand superfamily protein
MTTTKISSHLYQEENMTINQVQKNFIRHCFISFVLVLSISSLQNASADGGGKYSVYDTNSDGYLDRTEFEQFYESKRKRSNALDSWAFDTVDSDGDNKISEQEMVDALIKDMKQKKQK